MAYAPTKADATPSATDLAARLTTAGVSVAVRDTLVAMFDSILCATGLIGQNDAFALGSTSTTSASFADVGNGTSTGFASWTVTVPIAKTYLLHVGVRNFMSVPGSANTYYQVLVDGATPSQPTAAARVICNSTNVYSFASWPVPLALAAGSHTFKLQWRVDSGATANVDGVASRMFTLVGC